MKKLQEMNKKELSQLALEKGLKLSYTDKSGKRQRYTIDVLREMIFAQIGKEKLEIKKNKLYGPAEVDKSLKIDSEVKISKNLTKEKTVFEIFKDKINNCKTVNELKKLKNEISEALNLNQKIKSKIIKSNSAIDYNKLIFLLNKKKLQLV